MKPSCQDVCYMVSESLDRPLAWRERFAMRVHLMMCGACSQMARQVHLLNRLAGHYIAAQDVTGQTASLSESARIRILRQLKAAEGRSPAG